MVVGECIVGFVIIELSSGSDVGNICIKVVKKGDVYVFNGIKYYIFNVLIVGLFIVIVIIDLVQGLCGMSVFFVELQSIFGVSIGKIDEKMGQKGVFFVEVIFEDVEIFVVNLLGLENWGYCEVFGILMNGCVGIVVCLIGVMQCLFDLLVVYVQICEQFGKLIVEFQVVQFMLVEMEVVIQISWVLW